MESIEKELSDLGGKMVASRRQNRVRQLKDNWPVEPRVYRCLLLP